jgi:hypothetical protein
MDDNHYQDQVSRFLHDNCCFVEGAVEPVNELFAQFMEWCTAHRVPSRMIQKFSMAVVSHNGIYFDIQRHKGVIRRVFVGVSSKKHLCRAA